MKSSKISKISIWIALFFFWTYIDCVQGNDVVIASDWKISGQNVLHLDYYNSSGPNGAYLQEGWQPYNDLNLQFQNTANPYNTMKGYFSGTINQSPYRANNYGVLLERFNFNQENGGIFIPYRLDLGDFYAFQTPRILQRPLKGGQIELQPGTLFGASQSVLFQLGGVAQDYLDNKKWDNMFGGASWMMNWKNTRFALNYTANRRASQTETPSLQQYVWGMALNHNFSLFSQKITLDAEWDFLRGDNYVNGAISHNKGQGRFFQLQGRSMIPITYSFRYEEYDSDYLPAGGSVNGGRRVFDNRAGWQFAGGYSVNGRAQFYRDGMGTETVTDTDVFGLGMSGIVPNPWIKGVNGSIDAYRQHANSTASDTVTDSLNANLSAPLPAGWSARLSASLQDLTVRKGVAQNNTTQQYGFDIGRAIEIFDFKGTANAGLTYYMVRQIGLGSDNPGLNLSSFLAREPFRINLSYRYLMQNQLTSLVDNRNQGFNMAIEYTRGKHVLRAEGDLGVRQPVTGTESRDTRVSLTWTYSFERPARTKVVPVETKRTEIDATGAPDKPVKVETLADLSPGMPIKKALAALSNRNIKGGIEEGNNIVYETVWFSDISQRQRLVLSKMLNHLEKATVIVDINQVGDLDTLGQLYERIQAQLTRTFGSPVTQEKGNFTPNIANDLRRGTFIRISDWKTPTGTLRLGIPRRIDGLVRIEVQHAESFPLSSQVPWGLEEIQ